MKSNCKAVKTMIREHINDFYTPAELAQEVKNLMRHGFPTVYHAVRHMVEGGCFYVYNYQIREFLDSLNINEEGREFDSNESFALYAHLIARDAGLIVKHAKAC